MATTVKKGQIDSDIIAGWIPANETWTYASASTITVPSGATSKYQKGDRIKWTQTTVKYGVITAVADTLLTIAVNTDYTVADAAISANYYSHQANPIGYPHFFLVTFTTTSAGTQPTWGQFSKARFNIVGRQCFFQWSVGNATGGTAGSGANALYITLPVAADTTQIGAQYMTGGIAHYYNGGTTGYLYCLNDSATALACALTTTAYINCVDFNNASRYWKGSYIYYI